MRSLRDRLDETGHSSLRELAEDENVDFAHAVGVWWDAGGSQAGIADVLLMRACALLGVEVGGDDPLEHVRRWKV